MCLVRHQVYDASISGPAVPCSMFSVDLASYHQASLDCQLHGAYAVCLAGVM